MEQITNTPYRRLALAVIARALLDCNKGTSQQTRTESFRWITNPKIIPCFSCAFLCESLLIDHKKLIRVAKLAYYDNIYLKNRKRDRE